jgi:methylmalonyl-CoA/ethylmalonyl-CoA epimerase
MTYPPATFDHFAVATWSIKDAARLFIDVLGGEFLRGADDEDLRIRTVQIKLPPGVKVELMEPLGEDSYLHRYLTKLGPGFHHVTLLLDDIEEVLPKLEAEGFETVDTDLSLSAWRETFVRPSSGFGTLLQLVDTTIDWLGKDETITLDDVLAGKLVWKDSKTRWREET